ncbi:EmrE family multidrug efflux SMR transporter, partial [Bacillus sp. HC-Mk]
GFTRLWPSVGTIICYCASFWLLAQTLAYIPTGIAYAIWSGVGIVLISLLSWGLFGQRLDLPAIIGMMLICAGVLVINLLSRAGLLAIEGKVWRTVYYRFATREEREGKVSTNLIFKECRQSAAMKRVLRVYKRTSMGTQ